MRKRALWTILAAVALTTGCAAVGPNYVKPDIRVPEAWRSASQLAVPAAPISETALSAWWQSLNDPILTALIQEAVRENRTVKEARGRIREARARRGQSRAGLFPALDSSGSATKSGQNPPDGPATENELFAVGFDAGWEIDLFGGVRRDVEAADATLEASQAYLGDTLVSLVAEVAVNYVEARTYQSRLAVARKSLSTQEETLSITRSRFEAGLIGELPYQQARYNLAGTRSQIPQLEAGLEESKNRLAVLLGNAPGHLESRLAEERPIPAAPVTAAVGIPADMLNRRPDVRRAERLLHAQTARIGSATADLYPRIRLAGAIGIEALSAGDLFDAATRTWRIGPSVSWPVFDAGAIRSNIEIQSALAEQALYQYEAAVLTALEEVENQLTLFVKEALRREALQEAAAAAEEAAAISRDQFVSGMVDFQTVLDAERSVLSFRDQLAQNEGAITARFIGIYKALGGGWTSFLEQPPTKEIKQSSWNGSR